MCAEGGEELKMGWGGLGERSRGMSRGHRRSDGPTSGNLARESGKGVLVDGVWGTEPLRLGLAAAGWRAAKV